MNTQLLFDKSDMTRVMVALDSLHALSTKAGKYGIRIGNCGWAKAPDCWFVLVNKKYYYEVALTLVQNNVTLLPEETGR